VVVFLGAGCLEVLIDVKVLCPKRPRVALLASHDVGEGRMATAVGDARLARCSPVVTSPGALGVFAAEMPTVVHGRGAGGALRSGAAGPCGAELRGGRGGFGSLGLGQIDCERADRLAILDHLESDGEGHTVVDDDVCKRNVAVLGLVLHPRGEAEGVRGDVPDMFAEDAE
jgi:hypothetical protein